MDKIFWKNRTKQYLSVLHHPISIVILIGIFFFCFNTKTSEANEDIADTAKVFYFLNQWSTGVVTGPGTSASPDYLSEVQIPHSRSVWQTLFWMQPSILGWKGSTGVSDTHPICELLHWCLRLHCKHTLEYTSHLWKIPDSSASEAMSRTDHSKYWGDRQSGHQKKGSLGSPVLSEHQLLNENGLGGQWDISP